MKATRIPGVLSESFESFESLESRRFLSVGGFITRHDLVSDGAVPAAHVDANLKNPWGISYAPGGAFWVADNATGLSTLYDGTGAVSPSVFHIQPASAGSAGPPVPPANPTGTAFNSGSGFVIQKGGQSGPAKFLFVGEDGGISGWNPAVDPQNAVLAVDNSEPHAVYKGATLGTVGGRSELFVTNFRDATVEIYDDTFNRLRPRNAFVDRAIPKGFAPFNVQNIGGLLYVTYAKQDAAKHDDVGGAGAGYVDIYSVNGRLRGRLQHGKFLDSPWGVAEAPATWGKLKGDILIGQFKTGQIDIFNPRSGRFVDVLRDNAASPITVDGLWALAPGTGSPTASNQSIFFTAGSNGEADGLFGSLDFTAASAAVGGTGPTY